MRKWKPRDWRRMAGMVWLAEEETSQLKYNGRFDITTKVKTTETPLWAAAPVGDEVL